MNRNTRTTYSYSVLRYVHDIGTGEFINVGIVLTEPGTGYVGARFKTAFGRVKKTFPSLDTDVFKTRMRHLQAAFDRVAEGDLNALVSPHASNDSGVQQLVQSVLRVDDSSLQWSPPGGGLSVDMPATLNSLYQRFVTKYDADAGAVIQRKDDDVWRHFRSELEKRNVLRHLEEKVIAVTDDSVKFENAWKNGAWHCYEPLSFDLASDASIKEKAHRWVGQMLSIKDAHEAFKVYFLVGKPSDSRLNEAYTQAMSILRKAPASSVVEEENAQEFSESVAKAISAHGTQSL